MRQYSVYTAQISIEGRPTTVLMSTKTRPQAIKLLKEAGYEGFYLSGACSPDDLRDAVRDAVVARRDSDTIIIHKGETPRNLTDDGIGVHAKLWPEEYLKLSNAIEKVAESTREFLNIMAELVNSGVIDKEIDAEKRKKYRH